MKILEENDYLIKVEKCHKGLQMFLPERRLSPHVSTKLIKKYIVNGGQLFSNDFTAADIKSTILKPVDVPSYSIKCAIYLDILQHCKLFNYSPQCVRVEGKYGVYNVFDLMSDINKENDEKSDKLFEVLFNNGNIGLISEYDLYEGYRRLKPYLQIL